MKIEIKIFIAAAAMFLVSFTIQDNKWVIPESAAKVENPTDKEDSENLKYGKSLYAKHCKGCHGAEGLGDGTKAEELETFPGDFTTQEFQSQTDGALFYKTTEGREEMPAFDKKIPEEEDRWLIVNYLRTLSE